MSKFVVLHVDDLADDDSSLLELATVIGVNASFLSVRSDVGADGFHKHLSAAQAVATSATTLCALEDRDLLWEVLDMLDEDSSLAFFVYGYQPNKRHVALVRRLTGSAISEIESVQAGTSCSFPRNTRTFSRQLAGCTLAREPSAADCCFRLEANQGVEPLMAVVGKPTFVRTIRGNGPWFHWSAIDAIGSPSARIGEGNLSRRSDRFVPPIIFFRATRPDSCWENPVKTARVIIDDPLLRRKYGFLTYDDLLASLNDLGCGATTAFIPWNYQRTTRKAARYFAGLVPTHSVCIHGCDHTNNEFGGTDESILMQKGAVALERMEKHQTRTGIPFEPVMVFPQGQFSSAAMLALRRVGFLAVVNSTRIPTDSSENGLTLREELLPATNCHFGLPVFTRRYPKQLSSYALDLFLGKPAHIVEHHNWFAEGYRELKDCIQFLKEVEPDLVWPSIGDGLRRQHLRRQGDDGTCQVRFFTPIFEFDNPESEVRSVCFSKAEPEPGFVDDVTVDGKSLQFQYENGSITFMYRMRPRQTIVVRLHAGSQETLEAWEPGLKYRAQVSLRRTLSEFRDNYLARHPVLRSAARRVVRRWSSKAKARS